LESPLRAYRNNLISVQELPGFCALHEGLRGGHFIRCLRRTMRLDIAWARDQFAVDRASTSGDQVGILKGANPYPTIETFADQVNETIGVAGVNLELGMASCHFREGRGKMGRTERQRCSNSQAASKITCGENRFSGGIDLGADFGCVISERGPGLRESGAAGGSRKQLGPQFRFKARKPTADDRLGYTQPEGCRRNSSSVGHFHEGPELFN